MTLNLRLSLILIFSLLLTEKSYSQDENLSKEKPLYNSLLWEITGNDNQAPSYLYGTMHVSQKLAFHLGKPFYQAIESCDMVALELNPETWMKDLAETDLLQEAYSAYSYTEDFYKEAFKMPAPKNRELAYYLASNDNLINGLLYRSNNFSSEFEEDTYLDLYIFQTGRRMGKEIFSLENYKEVMEYSRKAMMPSDDDEEYNHRKMNDLFTDTSPQEVLQDSYRKGNLNLVDSVSQLMNPSKNFHKYMIVERNKGMANNMDSIMRAGTNLFTGVGAAHLPGGYGVIELLRAKGYTVKAIDKGIGGKSKLYQDKYDDLVVPFDYEKQDFGKEFYSVETPGTLYSMPSDGSIITYLHPNMSNGAYYWVKRIKMNAPLNSRNVEYTTQRIDSMLYENIPGDIVSKKAFTEANYRGFNIVNKTRQGDTQRYRICVTPLEVMIFKMGGSKDFVLDHGDRFFNSIAIDLPINKPGTVNVSPDEGGFTIDLPYYNMLYRLRNGVASGGPGLEYQAVDPKGDFYMMRKTIYNDQDYIEEDDFELNQFVKSFIKDSQYDTLMTRHMDYLGYPALEASFSLENSDKNLHVRMVIRGASYFFVSKLTHQSIEACDDYFNSLSFENLVYKDDFEELVDSTLSFKAHTAKMSDVMKLQMSMQNMYLKSTDTSEDDFEYLTKNRIIHSTKTGEEVLVALERYNTFAFRENIDSVWNEYIRDYRKNESMEVKRIHRYTKDSLHVMEALLVDTGSTRGIKLKYILSNRRMYLLKATVDTLMNPSEFITSTFDTFELMPDTVGVRSLFENKNDLFFEYLNSTDSLKISRAFEYYNMIDLGKEDEEKLMAVINNFHFEDHGMADRASLITMLSKIHSKRSMAFLQSEYMLNEDTVTYQLACLTALSRSNTLESRKILGKLLVNYPTIPSEISEMNAIYYPLFDSLEISRVLFPDFMELSTYAEYKSNNLNLLSSLIESGKLKPRVMKKYKRRLINEALIELKRQFAGEEGSEDMKNASWNLRNKLSRLNYDLLDYAAVIAPWYKKEEKVQKFFKDIERLKNKRTLARLACMMEDSGVPVSPELWEKLSSDTHSSSYILQETRDYEIENGFNSKYLTQDFMSFSQLVSEYDFEEDSTDVELLGKYLIDSKELGGYYYFYKAKRKTYYDDEYKWAIYYNGPQAADGVKVNAEAYVNEKSENILPEDDLDKIIDEIKLKLTMRGRRRYSQNSYNQYLEGY